MNDKEVVDRLSKVNEIVKYSCTEAGRTADSVTLIAVSKTKPIELIEDVYEAGVRDFGENKVQELCDKYEKLPKDIRWHLIGHLQTNKVKYIIDKVYMIHSVDSKHLADEISKQAVKKNITVRILIEVNVANEESKFGVFVDECDELVTYISKLPNIIVCGLMTVAPYVENPEENRTIFSILRKLVVDIKTKNIDNVSMECLSMGMSGDYGVAIEEGATYVRVGTAIFGERDYRVIS